MDILILEDEEDDAILLIEYLKKTPLEFNYSHATNKKSYIELLHSSSFDLILSDYNIPGFDVEEALSAARNVDKFIPFIVVSGVLDYESAISLVKDFGVNDFILKDNLGRLYNSIVRELNIAKTHSDLEAAKAKLTKQNNRLQRAQKVAKLGDWTFDSITGEITWSRELYHIYNRKLSEGPPSYEEMFEKYYLDENAIKLQRAVDKALNEAKPYDIDLKVYAGHEVKYIRHIGTPDQNEQGHVTSLHGIVQDVSAFMKLQQNIIESEQRLDAAIEGAKLGIWDSNLKEETTVTNKRWHEMLGYTTGEIGDAHALYQLFFNNLHPDDKPIISNELNSIKKGEKENFELTLRVKNKSGEYFTILDKGRALEFDSQGRAVRMIGTVLDITEQKKLELKLKESQFRLETAVEGASLGIWDANTRDETNIANDRWFEMIGYKPEEIEGDSYQFFFSRIHPEDGEKIIKEIKAIERGEKQSFEEIIRVKHKSGEYITILDKGTALEYDSEGLVTRMIGTHLDITELVSTQIRLQKSLEVKELLIREVHHRVKNNLAILAGLLELDIFAKGENSVISDAIGRIRSIAFVHELLYQTESMVDVDFMSYMKSYMKYINTTYKLDDIVIDSRIQAASINVNEAVPLGLLINELMTNSIKHGITDGGKIIIRFTLDESDGSKHTFYYKDSGPGIDPEKTKNDTLGLELIKTLLANLHANYELKTEGEFELKADFSHKEKGAFGNPLKLDE